MRRRTLGLVALCTATIVAAAGATVVMKAAFQTQVGGANFSKPYFMELLVGLAMTISLLFLPCMGQRSTRRKSLRHFIPLIGLAVSDLTVGIGDTLSVLYCPASIVSISNCSILVFGAVATRVVVGTRHTGRQWGGIGVAAIGVVVTGAAVIIGSSDASEAATTNMAPIGVALSLAARALQAVQFAFEERFMKGGRFSALLQVGAEGAIESVLCAAVVLPIVASLPGDDHGRLEDFGMTMEMLEQSPTLRLLCVLSIVCLGCLNPLSMSIGQQHGSVLRVFMDLGRPAVVWGASLIADQLSGGAYGEPWSSPRSWIELGGFATLLIGLALYCSGGEPETAGPQPVEDGAIAASSAEQSLLSPPPPQATVSIAEHASTSGMLSPFAAIATPGDSR